MSAFAGAALSLPMLGASGLKTKRHAGRRTPNVNASFHHPGPIQRATTTGSFSLSSKRSTLVASRAAADKITGEEVVYTFEKEAAKASKKKPNAVVNVNTTFVTDSKSETSDETIDASEADADAIVVDVLSTIADTDSGRIVSDEQRLATDANIAVLENIGQEQTPNALQNPLIFGDYDVSYVSTGGKQIGNPAGGRFRGALGSFLFRTTGLEQNLYEPNIVINRVAFLVFGLIPGEVVLCGTFEGVTVEPEVKQEALEAEKKLADEETVKAMTKKELRSAKFSIYRNNENAKYADDGCTVRAYFDSPEITLGGLPTFKIGPPSSVVLSTTYLDENVRLGKGSRGSLFVFTRKSKEQSERDRARWRVGAFGVTVMLLCTAALGFFAVKRFKLLGTTELAVATIAAVCVSFAMALVMRQGGIVAEDADYEEKYKSQAERARARATEMQQKMK